MSIRFDPDPPTLVLRPEKATPGYHLASQARRNDQERPVATDITRPNTIQSFKVKVADAPRTGRESGVHVVLEPVSPDPYHLTYACLLIPRFSTHHLIGDVADSLYGWMRQICTSYAWKLEYSTVRPEYLQWIMSVRATTPPSSFMHTIRKHTSQQIFEDFPRFKRENLSKDFWAPGYLVLVGSLPHSPDMIREFIRLTRQQQGILRR